MCPVALRRGVFILMVLVGGLAGADDDARRASDRRVNDAFPYNLVSSDHMLADLEELTAIGAHQGWRCCGSRGEAAARELIEAKLGELEFLGQIGLEVEEESFRTIAGMEMWQTRLELVIDGEAVEVPADAPAGDPYRIWNARAFDSDGVLTDWERDPVVAEGEAVVLRSVDDLEGLHPADINGRVVFLDFALVDWHIVPGADAFSRITTLTSYRPAGLVAVVTGSNTIGESHGTFAGDSSVLNYAQIEPPIPILFARLEDMGSAGVRNWAGLETVRSARLTWDTDIVTPGTSGNVVARIPGASSANPVILSAHLDSPNSPGALDNGSGSVALLEVARVLNVARIQPPTDLYLVWFGCHERGLHGSPHFAANHQELLDDALAIIELDAMARPLDGFEKAINLESRSYVQFGDASMPFPEYLQSEAADLGLSVETWDFPYLLSDITGFVGFDVPNALLDNLVFPEMDDFPSIHYAAHWHDPYDTVELAREVADVFEDLARVMLATVLETGRDQPELRVTPEPTHRAVFVASHTEAASMSPFDMTGFGMTLAWHGFDVDVVPFGHRLTEADLENADVVIAMPVLDFPNDDGDPDLYDERWRAAETAVLEDWVATGGGWLVLANTGYRLHFSNIPRERNEDWDKVNDLAERFGMFYVSGPQSGDMALVGEPHSLTVGVVELWLASDNAVPMALPIDATVLATFGGRPAAAVFRYGSGGVIALADIGMLGDSSSEGDNRTFWENLAEWAKAPP